MHCCWPIRKVVEISVMAGLIPAIHDFKRGDKDLDTPSSAGMTSLWKRSPTPNRLSRFRMRAIMTLL
jgi:hypothetical protein